MVASYKYRNEGQKLEIKSSIGGESNANQGITFIDNIILDMKALANRIEDVATTGIAVALEDVLKDSQFRVSRYTGALADSGFVEIKNIGGEQKVEIGYADADLPEGQRITTETAGKLVGGYSPDGYPIPDSRNPRDYAAIVHEFDPLGNGQNIGFLSIPIQNHHKSIERTIQLRIKEYVKAD